MLLCAQYVLPITSEPIHNGAVLVRDGVIRDVGTAAMLKLRYPDEETSDYGQAALLPGFVDLHTHLENAVLRGIVHDVPYATWIMTIREARCGRLVRLGHPWRPGGAFQRHHHRR